MMQMSNNDCTGAFKLLDKRLCAELVKHGITTPTDIQEKAIPAILEGRDVLIIAPTGSGKTEAAMLPLFHKLLAEKEKSDNGLPRLVYITPLRALNRDIFVRMEKISMGIGLSCMVRHGDSTVSERKAFLREPRDWFATTPESIALMLSHEKTRERLKGIKYVVIDEIHELVDSERGSMLEVALRRLKRLSGGAQLVGLSATISSIEAVASLYPFRRNLVIIRSDADKKLEVTVETSGQEGQLSPEKHGEWLARKIDELKRRYRSAIIFTNTRSTAELLGAELRSRGHSDIAVHHGSLSLEVRRSAETALKRGEVWGVVATSSLELGIDVGHLDVVIQIGSPRQALRLMQRAGRSGHRLGEKSRAVILAEPVLDDIVESAVIARRATSGELEEQKPHRNPLDVLVHQLVGLVLAGEARTIDEALEFLRQTYTFRELDEATLNEVLEYASQSGLIRVTGNTISPGKRSRSYYYSTNMIPDTKKIPVYTSTGERIGFLDEDFVLAKLAKDARFVLAGSEWVVLEIGDDKVVVKPAETKLGLPPAWEGELIPVDYKVAREECGFLARAHMEGVERVLTDYPFLGSEARRFIAWVADEARRRGFYPPSGSYVLLEYDESDRLAVIYSCLGSKGNDALASLLGHYISTRMGLRAALSTDPLRVYVELGRSGASIIVEKALLGAAAIADELAAEAEQAVKATSLFTWRLTQVARKMGMITPQAGLKEALKLVRYLGDTIAGKEALRELLHENLDVERAVGLLKELASNKKRILKQPRRGLSPYTIYGGRASVIGSTGTTSMPLEVAAKMVEKRALEKQVHLVCLNCGYSETRVVESLPETIVCKKCGARIIAPIPVGFTEMISAVQRYLANNKNKKGLSQREKELVEEAIERAQLVLSHGKNAVIALSTYGIGPRAARKALAALKFGWEEFLKKLVEEQQNWYRTREYWD